MLLLQSIETTERIRMAILTLTLESIQTSGYLDYQAAAAEAVERYARSLSLPMGPGDSLVVTLRDDIAPQDTTMEGIYLPRPTTPIVHVYTFLYQETFRGRLARWWHQLSRLVSRKVSR